MVEIPIFFRFDIILFFLSNDTSKVSLRNATLLFVSLVRTYVACIRMYVRQTQEAIILVRDIMRFVRYNVHSTNRRSAGYGCISYILYQNTRYMYSKSTKAVGSTLPLCPNFSVGQGDSVLSRRRLGLCFYSKHDFLFLRLV